MKTIIALLFLCTPAFAGQYSIDSFVKVGDGYGVNWFYTRISTTGWHYIATNHPSGTGGACSYLSPELQNISTSAMTIIGFAPDSLSWDFDNSQGGQTCLNVTNTGAGSDNMTYVDPAITEQEITVNSAHVYVTPNNLNPITVSNVVINNEPYTKYTVTQKAGVTYNAASLGVFECVIAKIKPRELHLQFLGFKQEKKGVIYHIHAGDREGDIPLGIPRCDYGMIEIASYRLMSP